MIKFEDVSFGFAQKELYDQISFEINMGDHAVLIGSNGTGKSTLLGMIANTEDYLYDGKIIKEPGIRIGIVSQYVVHERNGISVFDFLAEPFVNLQKETDTACAHLEDAEDMDAAFAKYQECLDQMDAIDGYNYEVNIKKELAVAGLSELESLDVNQISGGEYKLISIIRNMLLKPQLLIMDEPDVFLGFENIIGLSRLINEYDGTVIAVTHNRLLLNQCFDKILHIEGNRLQSFPGTFAEYNQAMLETKVNMQEHASKFDDFIAIQQANIEQLRKEASDYPDPRKGMQLKARVSYMERLVKWKGEYPFIEDHDYDFTFPPVEQEDNTQVAISVKDYSLKFETELLKDVNFEILQGEKVAIVGENGTGKSSMLKDIYDMLAGSDDLSVGYFRQIYDMDDGLKLSGGERNILQLKELAQKNPSILLLDEPTSHLDIYAKDALESAICEYNGTVLMVSHDFYTIMNCVDRILILENGTVRQMSGRAYRKSVYKKYFDKDIFEQEKLRKEKEMKVNALLAQGKYSEARDIL